jgi:hypothetical protein
MRFIRGAIPEAADFAPHTGGWRPLREPSPWLAQLLSLPLGLAIVLAVMFAWLSIAEFSAPNGWSLLVSILLLLLLIPVHEAIHIALHPGHGTCASTIVGFWPKKLLFYAHYDDELARNRFIAILVAPFLVLTVAPVMVCVILAVTPFSLVSLTVVNGCASCMDLFGVLLVLAQIPSGAIVRNKGWRTYWRSPV